MYRIPSVIIGLDDILQHSSVYIDSLNLTKLTLKSILRDECIHSELK
jgi:hypothetical protein